MPVVKANSGVGVGVGVGVVGGGGIPESSRNMASCRAVSCRVVPCRLAAAGCVDAVDRVPQTNPTMRKP